MIELIFLVVSLSAFQETARRRGLKGWPFITVALVGFLVFGNLAMSVFGMGPHFFFSWGWLGLTYLSIFLFGGLGRSFRETWNCPECRLFNGPSTIVCPCGFRPDAGSV